MSNNSQIKKITGIIFSILLSLILLGCTDVIVPSKEELQSLRNVAAKNKINHHLLIKNDSKDFRRLNKIINDINNNYYGNSEEVSVIIEKNSKPKVAALSDDTIYITTEFLEIMNSEFSYPEQVAILCHESGHILNNDWGHKIRNENSKLGVTVEHGMSLRVATSSNLGYKWAKKFNKDLSKEEYKESIKNDFNASTSSSGTYDKYKVSEEKFENKNMEFGNIADAQGFSLEVEYKSDKSAITCMRELGYNPYSLYTALKKTITSSRLHADKVRMEKRLERITNILQGSKL